MLLKEMKRVECTRVCSEFGAEESLCTGITGLVPTSAQNK
jgi:hypothetical protein